MSEIFANEILRKIIDEKNTQADIALVYSQAIRNSEDVDWLVVNRAITIRWSRSGLRHVKKMVWKLLEN